ncbi:MAG: hypothetical protein V5A57_01085 [Candidatus Paceibacterota bacterium]
MLSAENLPRDLRLIGGLTLLFALFQVGGLGRGKIFLLTFIVYLSGAVALFSLASGVSKKENWSWGAGMITFSIPVIGSMIGILLHWTSPVYLVANLLIPVLFLIILVKNKRKIKVSGNLSPLSFTVWGISFLFFLASNGYLLYLVTSRLQ